MHAEYQRGRVALKPTSKPPEKRPEARLYKSLEPHSIGSDALLAALQKPRANNLFSFQFRQIIPSHSRERVLAKLFAKA